jgi:beta-glucosidase
LTSTAAIRRIFGSCVRLTSTPTGFPSPGPVFSLQVRERTTVRVLTITNGWLNRDTAYRFAEYSRRCFEELKDQIDIWITLNEPWSSVGMGCISGMHAPGLKDRSSGWAAGLHLLLGHGLSVQAYRSVSGSSERSVPIGISHDLLTPRPASFSQEDREAADRAMDLPTKFFLDPLLGKPCPERHFKAYPEAVPALHHGKRRCLSG